MYDNVFCVCLLEYYCYCINLQIVVEFWLNQSIYDSPQHDLIIHTQVRVGILLVLIGCIGTKGGTQKMNMFKGC